MALSLPPLPGPGPSQADVALAIRAGSGVTIDSPGPDVVRDLAVSAEALRVVVGALRTGLLQVETLVAAVGTGDLSIVYTQISALQSQVSDKASVASVSQLAQSVAQVVSGLSDYARVGQIPTTPGEVGADPAGAAQAVRNLLTGYVTGTALSDGLSGKINVGTYNTRQGVIDSALAEKYIKPGTGIPLADLAQAVRDAIATGSGGGGATTISAVSGLQSALDGKATTAQITSAIDALKASAPAAYDTLAEIATELARGATAETALTNAIAAKYTKPGSGVPATDLDMTSVAGSAALAGAYLPRWKASTAYTAGALVLAPTGETVKAKADFTSTASYVAANWDVTAGLAAGSTSDAGVEALVKDAASLTRVALGDRFQATVPLVATATASATLAVDRHTPVDATPGALTMTLPTPTRIGQQIRVEKTDATTNTVTISGILRGATGAVTLLWQYEVRTLVAESLTSWRVASGNTPKAALDGAYLQLWRATTTYKAGQAVLSPTGDVVTAKVDFTSGATYSAANWNLSTVFLAATDAAAAYAPLASSLRVLVYTSGAYPARPSGLPGGAVRYIGPSQPSSWLANDEWINNS